MATVALTAPQSPARFTTAEFAWMCECDAFGDMKVELIDGVLHRLPLPMNRDGALQARVMMRLAEAVGDKRALGNVGIDLGGATVVVCDSAVLSEVSRGEDGWLKPDELRLVVEIAEGTVDRDYGLKQRLYAGAGVPTYWVVDLARRVVVRSARESPKVRRSLVVTPALSRVPLLLLWGEAAGPRVGPGVTESVARLA